MKSIGIASLGDADVCMYKRSVNTHIHAFYIASRQSRYSGASCLDNSSYQDSISVSDDNSPGVFSCASPLSIRHGSSPCLIIISVLFWLRFSFSIWGRGVLRWRAYAHTRMLYACQVEIGRSRRRRMRMGCHRKRGGYRDRTDRHATQLSGIGMRKMHGRCR